MPSLDRSKPPRESTSPEPIITLRESGHGSDDAAFVLSLARKTFLAYGSYDRYLEDWFRDDEVSTYVADVDARPVGFFMLTTYRDSEGSGKQIADLVAIAVESEQQSRGIGKRLLERAFRLALEAKPPARQVWLVVADGNSRAQRFFAGRGFRLREGIGVYPAGQRALRMVKSLEEES
jgi:ribosomal protein S18 acetylase RimI-like enzyme